MNSAQREVQLGLLQSEEECTKALEKAYEQAMRDLKAQIREWGDEGNLTPSQVYQKRWQESVYQQVSDVLETMQDEQYRTIDAFLNDCYTDNYVGVMYDLTQQGIPVAVPIQHDQVVKAVTTDSKLSQRLYSAMGKYLKPLKKKVAAELSRGFASNLHYSDIARNIEAAAHIGLSNAQRIARTEGHRIQCAAALDAQKAAKEAGADVVKQWDSTLDGRTRKSHRKLDGQIREIDEPFEVNGHKAQAPGQFGRPEEDINCRCAILQRAKWALDDDELKKLKERAEYFGLDKADTFDEFKKKWAVAAEEEIANSGANIGKMEEFFGAYHAEPIKDGLDNAVDPEVTKAWNKVADDFGYLGKDGDEAYYLHSKRGVALDIEDASLGNSIYKPYEIVYHEYGHHMDYSLNAIFGDKRYAQLNSYKPISETFQGFDESGRAIFDCTERTGLLGRTAKEEMNDLIKQAKRTYKTRKKTEAAQHIIEEVKKEYSLLDRGNLSDIMEGAGIGVEYPLGAGHGKGYWKNRDNGVEIFAEITSSSVNHPESLEAIKRYFPKTYQVYKDILKAVNTDGVN